MRRTFLATLGLVGLGWSLAGGTPRPLYPDLVVWRKAGAHLDDAEIVIVNGRKRLRFTGTVANRGDGPFELRGTVADNGTTDANQRVYYDDGSYTQEPVGTFVFAAHADHNHFHYAEFAAYRLRDVTPGGGVGATRRTSDKVGFAMWDVTGYDLTLAGAPRQAVYQRPDGQEVPPQGISIGWADVYARTLEDQDIDITGVPNGEYWLEAEADPAGKLRETNEGNNISRARIRITGTSVAVLPDGGGPPSPPPSVARDGIAPYPNPWRSDRHGGIPLRFAGTASGNVVKIFALNGRWLRSVTAQGGAAAWDLNDNDGTPVASGYYLYVVDGASGESRKGRLAILR